MRKIKENGGKVRNMEEKGGNGGKWRKMKEKGGKRRKSE